MLVACFLMTWCLSLMPLNKMRMTFFAIWVLIDALFGRKPNSNQLKGFVPSANVSLSKIPEMNTRTFSCGMLMLYLIFVLPWSMHDKMKEGMEISSIMSINDPSVIYSLYSAEKHHSTWLICFLAFYRRVFPS